VEPLEIIEQVRPRLVAMPPLLKLKTDVKMTIKQKRPPKLSGRHTLRRREKLSFWLNAAALISRKTSASTVRRTRKFRRKQESRATFDC
jgi:hypothetical protein